MVVGTGLAPASPSGLRPPASGPLLHPLCGFRQTDTGEEPGDCQRLVVIINGADSRIRSQLSGKEAQEIGLIADIWPTLPSATQAALMHLIGKGGPKRYPNTFAEKKEELE